MAGNVTGEAAVLTGEPRADDFGGILRDGEPAPE